MLMRDSQQHGVKSDHRLSSADVALQETVHGDFTAQIDANHDGFISYDEFATLVQREDTQRRATAEKAAAEAAEGGGGARTYSQT